MNEEYLTIEEADRRIREALDAQEGEEVEAVNGQVAGVGRGTGDKATGKLNTVK